MSTFYFQMSTFYFGMSTCRHCVSDWVELRGVVNIASPTFGDQQIFLINSAPWNLTHSQVTGACTSDPRSKVCWQVGIFPNNFELISYLLIYIIPRRDCESSTKGGQIVFTFFFNFVLGNVCWTFNLQAEIRLFETLKMFYPPKALWKQYWRWSNCFYLCFNFEVGNVYWTFNLLAEIRLFETLKMFYPPKGLCKAEQNGVHFDSFHFIVV